MASSAGKYLMFLFFGGWMFFLGVLVGRGNAPVSFDTRTFQEKAAAIVKEIQANKVSPVKPDLVFYDVLKKPARTGVKASDRAGEILPAGSNEIGTLWKDNAGSLPAEIKRSRKSMTLNPEAVKESRADEAKASSADFVPVTEAEKGTEPEPAEQSAPNNAPRPEKAQGKATLVSDLKPVMEEAVAQGDNGEPGKDQERYSIQVAAFKDLKDAIKQIELLRVKGYTTYRTMGSIGNVIWHRVRIGPFSDKDKVRDTVTRLHEDGFNAMILENE